MIFLCYQETQTAVGFEILTEARAYREIHGGQFSPSLPKGYTRIHPDQPCAAPPQPPPNRLPAKAVPTIRNRDSVRVVDPQTGLIYWERAFDLAPNGLVIRGQPSFQQWTRFGYLLKRLNEGAQWAIADWLNYGESRVDWGHKYTQALNDLGYDYGYLRNIASVGQRYGLSERNDKLTFSHHAAAVTVPEPQRAQVLEEAATQRLSVAETQVRVGQVTGKPVYTRIESFEGSFADAVQWLTSHKDARGWDKACKVVLYGVQNP